MSFFLFSFSNPTQFQKILYWLNRKNCMYNTDHIKMHPLWLSSRQDKTSIKLLVNKVLPIIRQENNTGKDFFFPLFFWSKTISIEMQSYHTCQKIALQNMNTTEQRKWLLELERDLWWKPLKWVKFLFRTAVDCTLCFFLIYFLFIHSNTSPYAAYQLQICISVFDTQFIT